MSIAVPYLIKEFGLTKPQMGWLGSTFLATYAVGKFVNGILADKANVKTFFASALVLAGFCLVGFAFSLSLGFISVAMLFSILCFWWGTNGWFQSMTFPPISKSLSFWFNKKERGSRWSIVSTSHQVGVLAATAIAAYVVERIGVQSVFYIPGIISIIGGIILFKLLHDKPVTLGLPEVESYQKVNTKSDVANSESEAVNNNTSKENLNYFQFLLKYILNNPAVWMLTIAFLCVYVVRSASEYWTVQYFVEMRGYAIEDAAVKYSSLSLAGVAGTILSGTISDKLFKGRRTPVNIAFLVGLLGSIFIFANNPIEFKFLDLFYVGAIGFFTGGLQNLIGLQVVEMCAKEVASAANGFAGTVSYVGAMFGTTWTGSIAEKFGWTGVFNFWMLSIAAAIALFLLVIPVERIWRAKLNKI